MVVVASYDRTELGKGLGVSAKMGKVEQWSAAVKLEMTFCHGRRVRSCDSRTRQGECA